MKQLQSSYRTHTCGELRASDEGAEVRLSGWVSRKRDHGGVVFVDLRDHYGVTQVVFHDDDRDRIQDTRVESVIQIHGKVRRREAELINPKIETGEIEIYCDELIVHSEANVLPFLIADDDNASEVARLTNRFLELRKEKLHANILLRSRIVQAVREIMHTLGFQEFQTPILTSSSPEGARDYIVPSRRHPGKFYALPQAPQQFKQLLMVAGFDRYFQIAPCFRDEDARADRSPGEFYQIDLEMSFVEQEDVLNANEALMADLFPRFTSADITERPFPRFAYADVMARYGTDKPDLRNPLQIGNISELMKDTEFRVFQNVLSEKGSIHAIKVALDEVPPRKYFDDTIAWFQSMTGQGLAYLVFNDDEVKGSVKKFFSEQELESLRSSLAIDSLSVVFFGAGKTKKILPWMGKVRNKLGQDFDLLEKDVFKFCWVVDYPIFEEDETTGQIVFSHNPFSMPTGGMDALENKNPLEITGQQYDLVLNGYELGSGAIRNHKPDVMYKAFEIAGYPNAVVDEKFGGMIRAFQYGAPPHGGFAHGVDRIVMLLAGEEAIREVITFPLAQTGEDLMMGAPSDVSQQALDDVHIELNLPPDLELEQN